MRPPDVVEGKMMKSGAISRELKLVQWVHKRLTASQHFEVPSQGPRRSTMMIGGDILANGLD